MTRAVTYCRYSNELQNPLSIQAQVRKCEELAARENWTVVGHYSDAAISGFSIHQRPGIQKLMADAEQRKFDVVVSEGLDRLSRDQEDIARLFKRLTFFDIEIVTLQEQTITSLHVGLKGTMNAVFLNDLKIKVKRGLQDCLVEGRSAGGNSYGYNVLRNLDGRGELIRGERTINPEEAEIVKRIFGEYAAGISPRSICHALNAENVPAPTGAKWAPTTLYGNWQRGSGILNNELYVGERVWNKVSYIKHPDTGKHVARVNPAEEHVRLAAPALRIVDQAVWDKVKARQLKLRKVHKKGQFWKHQRPRYLFSYLLKCGCCGSGMAKISKTHYGCSAARNKGDAVCTNRRGVRQDELESTVMALLKGRLMNPALLEVFCKEYTAHINRLRRDHNASVGAYKSELSKLQSRQKRIVKAVMDGYDTPSMKDESNAIHLREQELSRLLTLQTEVPVILHPNMAERYRKSISELIIAIRDEDNHEAVEILRSLIDKVVMTPDPESDGLLINLYGDLAGIVKIASGRQELKTEEEEALKQIRFVSGVLNRGVVADILEEFNPVQGKVVAGEPHSLGLHSINNQPKRRTVRGKASALSILQGKMVGPAGLEPATRPL